MKTTRTARWTGGLALAAVVLLAGAPAVAQNQNVTVDDQPTAEQRVGRVKELHRAGRLDQAAELMQELIEGSRFKLVGLGDGNYSDAERWCRKTLLTDPALQDAYRKRYSATARHALSEAVDAPRPIDPLLEVYRRYTVTPAGLDAGLRLVGLLLESGEALSAASVVEELREHPDREAAQARLTELRGAAAAYTHDLELVHYAAERLTEQGEAERADRLEQLAGSIQTGARTIRPALTDAGAKPQTLDDVLWQQPMATAEKAEAWVMRDVFTLPAVSPSLVMINNGRQVVALDRASGQRAWAYPEDDDEQVTRTKFGQRWFDARSVAIGSGMAAAVLGECYGIADTRNPFVLQNKLACIDPQTGQPRWERNAGSLREGEPTLDQDRRRGRVNLQHTHFVGTPVITRGNVLVLLRRTSTQRTQSTWLVCYDGEDGSLRWYRHVSLLSLNNSRDSDKTTPQITLHGETAYVTDGIATVAAVDVYSGGYRWLRVLPVGYGATQRLTLKARGVLSPPVMTRAGLLVCLSLQREPMMLLDPEDGSVLQDFDDHPTLGDARYMLEAEGGAVIVSYNSVSFWDAKEAAVAWTFNLDSEEYTVGRGDATKRYIVVPTMKRVVVLDRATGELIDQARPESGNDIATNLIVRGGELFTVHDDHVSLYATWDSVFDRLVQRVEQSPDDPSGGIALASLAMKQEGMEDVVLEGVGYALKAVGQSPAHRAPLIRKRLFGQLRSLIPLTDEPTLRAELYDRLALVSETAAQEAAYHLDAGRFYASQGRAERAVEHFHAVLSEPAFVAEPYEAEGVDQPAGAFAKAQIERLIQRFGRGVYARQDAIARAWLEQVKAEQSLDSAALIAIARRYPLSLGTVQVLLDAANQSRDKGRDLDALSLYQQAVVRAGDRAMRAKAVGLLLSYYLSTDRHDEALDLVGRQTKRDATLEPIDPDTDEPTDLRTWRERAQQREPQRDMPDSLGNALGQPTLLPGRLIRRSPALAQAVDPPSRLIVQHDDGSITCHTADNLATPDWSTALPGVSTPLELLADRGGQVLLWSPTVGKVFALDAGTGQTQWSTHLPLRAFADQVFEPDPPAGPTPAGDPDAFVATVSATVLCLGHRASTQLLAIDRATGSLLWKTTFDFNRLTAIDADDWQLVVAGPAGHPNQVRTGRLALLDLFTGERLNPESQRPIALTPQAIQLQPDGQAVLVGNAGVAQLDPQTGRVAWMRRVRMAALTDQFATAGRAIVVVGDNGVAYAMDRDEGGMPAVQLLMRDADDPDDLTVHPAGGRAIVRGGHGLLCIDDNAQVAWRFTSREPGEHPAHLVTGGQAHALFTRRITQDQPDATWRLSLIDADGGRLLQTYDLDPLDGQLEPDHARRIAAALAIPAGNQTLVVPSK